LVIEESRPIGFKVVHILNLLYWDSKFSDFFPPFKLSSFYWAFNACL